MAGFVALAFVLLGLVFSLLLPKQPVEHVVERIGPEEPVPAVARPEGDAAGPTGIPAET